MCEIIKVDRVSSLNEACLLQDLGVNFITVAIDDHPNFCDNRSVSIDTARSIRRVLHNAKFGLEIIKAYDIFEVKSIVDSVNFDYVQLGQSHPAIVNAVKELSMVGITVVCSELVVSAEDDPSWIVDSITEIGTGFFSCQIDLLGDIRESWNYLKNESPKYADGFNLENLNSLCEIFPIIVSMDYTSDNIKEIFNSIPLMKGICMTLGNTSRRNDFHFFDVSSVSSILNTICTWMKT